MRAVLDSMLDCVAGGGSSEGARSGGKAYSAPDVTTADGDLLPVGITTYSEVSVTTCRPCTLCLLCLTACFEIAASRLHPTQLFTDDELTALERESDVVDASARAGRLPDTCCHHTSARSRPLRVSCCCLLAAPLTCLRFLPQWPRAVG